MIKYVPEMTSVVMEEIPEMVTLAVEISNCQGNCLGCHSPFLKKNVGIELTQSSVDKLINDNYGINCFLFLGEGNDNKALLAIASYIKNKHNIYVGLYSGRHKVEAEIYTVFDYVKVGPYIAACGPLNSKTTNQRLYKIKRAERGSEYIKEDITYKFWRM